MRQLARGGALLVVLFGVSAAALIFAAASGDWVLFQWCLVLALHSIAGLWLSFAIHEVAHLLFLSRIEEVKAQIDFKLVRVSIVPIGIMSGWQIANVALAGPLVCVVIGFVLALVVPDLHLQLWFFGHVVFLLPLFGDGKSLIKGLLVRGRSVRVP